jgi:glycosyltransferase involved in cell wall biosynthesis
MDKLLTVSIAAYNAEKTIGECLDSFLTSSYLNELELIVVNDGSSDCTADIVSKYEKKYPGTIRLINKKNGGHGSTLNASLKLAKGKFYKVIDGDDWVNVIEFDKLCNWLKSTDADLVINSFKWCYPNYLYEQHDEIKYNLHHTYEFGEMLAVQKEKTPLFPMTEITISTSVLRSVKMKIKEKCFYADNEFVIFAYLASETISFDNSCAYCYRMGQITQSVSNDGLYRHLEDYFSIFEDLCNIYDENSFILSDNLKKLYVLKFMENYYNECYNTIIKRIDRPDKDYLLEKTVKRVQNRHPIILNQIRLRSITNRITSINPTKIIPLMRFCRKTLIFRFLRSLKNVLK